ncbi:MAG: zinc metalloprotease HtpX [Dehalococcoidia bacterium]|nr:zinc metalloprotease HtpX [Dehalococcoidia bacterium]
MIGVPRRIPTDRSLQARMLLTMLLLGGVYGVFLSILWNLGASVVLMLILASLMVLFQFWFSDRMVLTLMRAKVVTPEEAPDLHAMIDRLSAAAGIPKPRVAVSEMRVPNAFATGRNQRQAAVCVTAGLVSILNKRELEGVLAHEISHIRTRDVQVMTYASFFAVVASTLMMFFFWMGLFGGFGGRRNNEGNAALIALLVTLVVWLVSQILIAALSRYREFSADRGAAFLTGRPQDLASALQRIDGAVHRIPKDDLRRVESMSAFFIMPAVAGGLASLFSTHPNTERRIAQLRELEREVALG